MTTLFVGRLCFETYSPVVDEVDLYGVGTTDSALIREVSFIRSALYREVPQY